MKMQETIIPFISNHPIPSSVADEDRIIVSFGLVVSCPLGKTEAIRQAIMKENGRIAYQIVSNGGLFLLREGQAQRILGGDNSELKELYTKKKVVKRWVKKQDAKKY